MCLTQCRSLWVPFAHTAALHTCQQAPKSLGERGKCGGVSISICESENSICTHSSTACMPSDSEVARGQREVWNVCLSLSQSADSICTHSGTACDNKVKGGWKREVGVGDMSGDENKVGVGGGV